MSNSWCCLRWRTEEMDFCPCRCALLGPIWIGGGGQRVITCWYGHSTKRDISVTDIAKRLLFLDILTKKYFETFRKGTSVQYPIISTMPFILVSIESFSCHESRPSHQRIPRSSLPHLPVVTFGLELWPLVELLPPDPSLAMRSFSNASASASTLASFAAVLFFPPLGCIGVMLA